VDGTVTEPQSFISIREITPPNGVDFVIGTNKLDNKNVSTGAPKYLLTIFDELSLGS
jgi:hypothetical protein